MDNDAKLNLVRDLINNKTIKYISVIGKSMVPTLVPEDRVYIIPYEKGKLSVGDIIIFFNNGKLIIHRILKLEYENVITKGDNSPEEDGIIEKNMILAIAVKRKSNPLKRIELFTHYLKKRKFKKAVDTIKYGFYKF